MAEKIFHFPEKLQAWPKAVPYREAEELNPGLFFFILYLCEFLRIDLPYISIADGIATHNHIVEAMLFLPENSPDLEKPLIVIAKTDTPIHFAGVLASQLRLIWQRTYHESEFLPRPKTSAQRLSHPGEVDSDAFAIAIMYEMDREYEIEYYGKIMCPGMDEDENSKPYFATRIINAKMIYTQLQERGNTVPAK